MSCNFVRGGSGKLQLIIWEAFYIITNITPIKYGGYIWFFGIECCNFATSAGIFVANWQHFIQAL